MGAGIVDTEFREKIRNVVGNAENNKHLSTLNIEHKKIENLQNEIGLDYQQTIFFLDTTMVRNNGSLGLGMTTGEFRWSFENQEVGRMPVNNIIFSILNEQRMQVLNFAAESNGITVWEIDFDTTVVETLMRIKAFLEAQDSNVQMFRSKVDELLNGDSVDSEVLNLIDNLPLTNDEEHVRTESLIIDNVIQNNDWRQVISYLEQLGKYDVAQFRTKCAAALKAAGRLVDDEGKLQEQDQDALLTFFQEFDETNDYLLETVRLQINLGDFWDARMTCLTKLGESSRKPLLDKMDAIELSDSREAAEAVFDEDLDYFKENEARANELLAGGVMPAELALLMQKSPKFIKKLRKLTDEEYLNNSANAFGFTWDMMAASQRDLDYFIKVTNHDSRPSDLIIGTGVLLVMKKKYEKLEINRGILRDQVLTPQRTEELKQEIADQESELAVMGQAKEAADRKLEQDQEEWDSLMASNLRSNYAAFNERLMSLDEDEIKNNLRVRYVEDEESLRKSAQEKLQTNQVRIKELKERLTNMANYLMEKAYNEAPLERGEFEEESVFDERVLDYKRKLLMTAEDNSGEESEKASDEIMHLESKVDEERKFLNGLHSRIEAEQQILELAYNNWLDAASVSELLKWIGTVFADDIKIGHYVADTQKFEYEFQGGSGSLSVPIKIAQEFRENFSTDNVIGIEKFDDAIKVQYKFADQVFSIQAIQLS
ncbi:hypothetical protein [Lactiplantibacillus plajomi]|uniref:Uncharacterized protein n=1 Tax=Lactiplantibacillus plajomi TaxID=1457217 RepID=A0ABV6K2F9_9LACO|nr:hypothetical protein [Lactiplantibacillus plajomi]